MLIFNTPDEEPAPSDFTVIEPQYIPEGFEVANEVKTPYYYEREYKLENSLYFIYSQESKYALQKDLDTESTYSEKILLFHDKIEAFIIQIKKAIIWYLNIRVILYRFGVRLTARN